MPRVERDRIFLVEDTPSIREQVKMFLEDNKYTVSLEATTLEEALARTYELPKLRISLVLLDLNLRSVIFHPSELNRDGEIIFKEIKGKYPQLPIARFSFDDRPISGVKFDLTLNKRDLFSVPAAIAQFRKETSIVNYY